MLGCLVVIGGSYLSVLAERHLQPTEAVSFFLSLYGIAVPMVSGALGALFAHRSPVFNGTLSSVLGMALMLLFHGLPITVAALFLASTFFLALLSSLFVVYVWPRHGL